MRTVRLTTAQAIVRYLTAQRTLVDGEERPLLAGVFGIFGHGNVTCLGEALHDARDVLPTYRGQSEQGMALAAIGFAKAMRRRQFMAATSSVGPGAMNMVTAAAVAHANRLPLLLLAGDTFRAETQTRAQAFHEYVRAAVAPRPGATEPSYAQVVAAVNSSAGPDDYAVSSAGGLPGELNVNWLARGIATFDCEYGFSCMGYELAGAWGGEHGAPARRGFRVRRRRLVPDAELGTAELGDHRP